jgi:IclR family acetate operon transcriptional repressor
LKAGVSRSDPNRDDGYASIAAPIFDHSKSMRAAITLTGPLGALEKNDEQFRLALIGAAATISQALGHRSTG